ncbi:RNA demethylase ALKBH9B-like protein [Drosera capensis]
MNNKNYLAGGGGEWVTLLRGLEPSEIIEVLSAGEFCGGCRAALTSRVLSFVRNKENNGESETVSKKDSSSEEFWSAATSTSSSSDKRMDTPADNKPTEHSKSSSSPWSKGPSPHQITQPREPIISSAASVNSKPRVPDSLSSEEQKEWLRCSQVGRKKDFVHYERIHGKDVNVLEGLELHTGVFDAKEQSGIVRSVYELQKMGQKGHLRARTYTEPRKWMPGKGRVTIQFGCCYNYSIDKDGNPPGIIREEEVDPLPPVFKQMIQRLVRCRILPPTCVPNSCIVNIYDKGDCIPPHIDHHDFVRPFCTVSLLAECNILFGSKLNVIAPGEFSGPVSIPLPLGISVTFRKMDESKIPYGFTPDPELLNIKPLVKPSSTSTPTPRLQTKNTSEDVNGNGRKEHNAKPVIWQNDDFPPLGALSLGKR